MFNQYALAKTINAAGLAIKAGSSAVAKTVNTVYFALNGSFLSATAGDVALTGITVAAGYKQVVAVLLDSTGAKSVAAVGSAVATSANVGTAWFGYSVPNKAVAGFLIISNGSASAFTGGTTALDASDITVQYVDVANASLIGA